ncbi:putative ABC transporter ATP-binding protein YbhF [Clostridium perfringens]|uniref:ATP-binding cassette domain-containing protein n=1 Tax=Clostridium perfringens TaxID=1502 RepID=UPI00244480DB|nr:ATP-binding cassette domain-containing protein [Clostridium perfringens]MDG6880881.1 putative ABC transporter ATP-binding protein YbhF [Clostridium perfringens]
MDSLENIIEVKEISKSFNNSNFKIENLSFELKKGQITGLVGKNGAGKTTIIKILIGLLAPDSGSIKILNEDLKKKFWKS